MDPTAWGPSAWAYLHLSALHADRSQTRVAWSSFFEKFIQNVPCDACQKHASQYILKTPYKVEESAFAYTVQFHNIVNQRLGKTTISLDQAHSLWQTDRCASQCGKESHVSRQDAKAVSQSSSQTSSFVILLILICVAWLVWNYREELKSKWDEWKQSLKTPNDGPLNTTSS